MLNKVPIMLTMGVILMGAARAETYYIAGDGDDGAIGTREAPWGTLAHANEALQPGDTVVLLDGEHAGVIEPARSGEEGAPITYRAANEQGAVLRGGEASDGEVACVCRGTVTL